VNTLTHAMPWLHAPQVCISGLHDMLTGVRGGCGDDLDRSCGGIHLPVAVPVVDLDIAGGRVKEVACQCKQHDQLWA
jgi:hypothetical protein